MTWATTTRQSRGYGKDWDRVRKLVLIRDKYICHWCRGKANSADHVIAKCNGGSSTLDNLVAACMPCNERRGRAEARAKYLAKPSRRW